MITKRAYLLSIIFHLILFLVLFVSRDWSWPRDTQNPIALEAQIVIKNKTKNKDLLPKKPKDPAPQAPKEELKKASEAPPPPDLKPKTETKKIVKDVKPSTTDYTSKLTSLTQGFLRDVENSEQEEELEVTDHSYFSEIYYRIKNAFLVPQHLNGPQALSLKVVMRLYLDEDGSLNKLDIVSASGDEHFDLAVKEAAEGIKSFGAVPVELQNVLKKRGILVELCPIKCR